MAHFSHRIGCTILTVLNIPEDTLSQECIIRSQSSLTVVQCSILCSHFSISAVVIKIQTGYIHKWASYHSWRGTEKKMIGILLARD